MQEEWWLMKSYDYSREGNFCISFLLQIHSYICKIELRGGEANRVIFFHLVTCKQVANWYIAVHRKTRCKSLQGNFSLPLYFLYTHTTTLISNIVSVALIVSVLAWAEVICPAQLIYTVSTSVFYSSNVLEPKLRFKKKKSTNTQIS